MGRKAMKEEEEEEVPVVPKKVRVLKPYKARMKEREIKATEKKNALKLKRDIKEAEKQNKLQLRRYRMQLFFAKQAEEKRRVVVQNRLRILRREQRETFVRARKALTRR